MDIVKRMSGKQSNEQKAFKDTLSGEGISYFNDVAKKPFSEQAVFFLNAYWEELSDQAEFIFSVAWETIKYADMHTKGVQYIHLYEEGKFSLFCLFFESK